MYFVNRLQVGQYVTVNGEVVSHLNISSIHTNDGGLYKCIASSKVGSAEHAAKLNVYGLPFIRPMEKKAIVAGETLMVTCPVAGYPIETIVWERGSSHSIIHCTFKKKKNLKLKCIEG
jgi:Immunoglobulin I-set domain.